MPKSKKPKKQTPDQIRKEVSQKEFDSAAAEVKAAWRNDQTSARDFGQKLLALRKLMYTHGQFTKWLRANGVDQNRASYCMRKALNKAEEAQEKGKLTPQAVIKRKVDELFKMVYKEPFTHIQLSERMFEINELMVVWIIKVGVYKAGWTAPKDIRRVNDPRWVDASWKIKDSIDNLWKVLFYIDEMAKDGSYPPHVATEDNPNPKAAAAASAGT